MRLNEITIRVATRIATPDGHRVTARIRGREVREGVWEGWVEFGSPGGSPVLRTPREAERATREGLIQWAEGLTESHLEEALGRAFSPESLLPGLGPSPADGREDDPPDRLRDPP